MPSAVRIVKTKYVATAFDGEGARRNGGRWNSVGTPMVYTSQSLALCMLEMLVHLDSPSPLPHYSLIRVEWDDSLPVKELTTLPPNWRDPMAPVETQQMGDSWCKSRDTVILRVPSVIAPSDFNFLINPLHPNFSALRIGAPEPFSFDPRLIDY